jgi:AcrR family transcriptional regulator
MELFLERGYAEVTVADITRRAGLTKRSFFNHFADKREVLFADAVAFQQIATECLAALDPATDPLQAATAALAQAGLSLAVYMPFAAARRALIASSTELRERELVKMASLSQGLQEGLIARGSPARSARFTAEAAITVFKSAYDDWIDAPDADFAALINRSLEELRIAIERPKPTLANASGAARRAR